MLTTRLVRKVDKRRIIDFMGYLKEHDSELITIYNNLVGIPDG